MAKVKKTATAAQPECDHKKWLLSAVILFVFLMGYDFVVHGKLLHDMYDHTKSLWRTDEDMKALFPLCMLPNALFALLIAGAYGCWRKNVTMGEVGSAECPYRKSICFGVWIGLFMGVGMASNYIYMPIPDKLGIAWFLAGLGKGVMAGIVLNIVAMKCGSCKA